MKQAAITLTSVLSSALESIPRRRDRPILIGLSGPQGVGKSTAMRSLLPRRDFGIVSLSLDDFYLPLAERAKLAATVSPLLDTRGPPGTHDLELLNHTLDSLIKADRFSQTPSPIFSKSMDNRLPETEWMTVQGRPDIILLEGWMVGATAHDAMVSAPPMNIIEDNDEDRNWRTFQYEKLRDPYQALWNRFSAFIHIQAPNFYIVEKWRLQQEFCNYGSFSQPLTVSHKEWVKSFVCYFERITTDMAAGSRRPGTVIHVDENRNVLRIDESCSSFRSQS